MELKLEIINSYHLARHINKSNLLTLHCLSIKCPCIFRCEVSITSIFEIIFYQYTEQ